MAPYPHYKGHHSEMPLLSSEINALIILRHVTKRSQTYHVPLFLSVHRWLGASYEPVSLIVAHIQL